MNPLGLLHDFIAGVTLSICWSNWIEFYAQKELWWWGISLK